MPFVYLLRHESYECENFSAIASEELMSITKSIQSEISRNGKVAVHCRGGNGRTGTVLGNTYDWNIKECYSLMKSLNIF